MGGRMISHCIRCNEEVFDANECADWRVCDVRRAARREEAKAEYYYSLEAAVHEHRREQEEREAELAAARREGVIEAAHYARSLSTICGSPEAERVLLDLAETLERGEYRRPKGA